MQISRLAARFPAKKYRLAKNFRQPQLVKKVFLTSWWTGEQAIHNSQWSPCCAWRLAVFPCSLGLLRAASPTGRALRAPPATAILNSQWSFRIFAPPSPSAVRCSVAAHCASLRVLATPALRASDVRPSLAHWAYYGLFPPQAAAFVRPPPVSAKILRIFGRGNCKEAIFALENGIFRRKNRPVPAVHAAGDD